MKQDRIRFGTDGWRAIIAKDYTVENVQRISWATGRWMRDKGLNKVVIGHDCRFGGPMFAIETAKVMVSLGIEVWLAEGFVSTPMVSLGVVRLQAGLGIVITASHNPPDYNGFKLKSAFGGPTLPEDIKAVEALIPDAVKAISDADSSSSLIHRVDLEQMYLAHVSANFDMAVIRGFGSRLAFDAMYGAGQRIMRAILPNVHMLHGIHNPGFDGRAPEPIHRNLSELSDLLRTTQGRFMAGLANDGDADRIGMYDSTGRFVDSHHLLLILLMYMHEFKGLSGKVVITFSVTDKMVQLAEKYGLPYAVTPIGFKYIAEIMTCEDVLVGGEESGGLAVKGHIPERDGVWIGLLVLEFMALTGKSLEQLVGMVYDRVGRFAFDRWDLHVEEPHKQAVIEACRRSQIDPDNILQIKSSDDLDGFKFIIPEGWLMFRPSGTEPVLRVYAQGANDDEVQNILTRANQLVEHLRPT